MSGLALEHGAINLSQGFPDFAPPARLLERVAHHMAAGSNQYAMMHGAPSLREAIAEKVARLYQVSYDVEREISVTAGATVATIGGRRASSYARQRSGRGLFSFGHARPR